MNWKFSIFSFPVEHKGIVLIKNTFTGAIVSLKKDDYNELTTSLRLGTIPKWATNLKGQNGILVKDNIDEEGAFKKLFLKTREANQILTIHILPTLACQLNCPYCFERYIPNNKRCSVKDTVIDSMFNLLDSYIVTHTIKAIKIIFFGGEPLLRKDLITNILSRLKLFSTTSGIKIKTELVTNGELLDKEICELFKKHNWTRLQVTLDGFKDTHNKTRRRKDGKETFDTIIDGIKLVFENKYIDKIDLRINLSKTNFTSARKLINYLADLNLSAFLNVTVGLIESYDENSCPSLSCNARQEEIDDSTARNYLKLSLLAKQRGFNIQDEFVAGPICIATMKHSVVIQPDGGMQKCFCSVGIKEFNFANLLRCKQLTLRDQRFEFFDDRIKKCIEEKCSFLPMCNGGCVWRAVHRHGSAKGFKERSCQREAMEIINGGLMKNMIALSGK